MLEQPGQSGACVTGAEGYREPIGGKKQRLVWRLRLEVLVLWTSSVGQKVDDVPGDS